MPVFGIEYKDRKSDQRFGITPSLIARYTTGSQLGIKVRSKLADDWLILAASVTNNSSTIEMFHFYSEIDKNNSKTLNGRAAVSIPVGRLYRADDRLELGVSGEWGAQDRATDNSGKMWFAGARPAVPRRQLRPQGPAACRASSPGHPDALDGVWGLDLNPSGYLEIDWQLLARFGDLRARREPRRDGHARHRAHLRHQGGRASPAASAWSSTRTSVVKAEYLHNDEYGGINEFDNDVATSSLVLLF